VHRNVLGNNENAEKICGETKVNSREKTRIHTPIKAQQVYTGTLTESSKIIGNRRHEGIFAGIIRTS